MIDVNIHEAKTQLSRLIKAAIDGQEVVISKRNKPVARLVPVEPVKVERNLGWAGEDGLWMADDFDAPLEDFASYM